MRISSRLLKSYIPRAWAIFAGAAAILLLFFLVYTGSSTADMGSLVQSTHAPHKIAEQIAVNRNRAKLVEKERVEVMADKLAKATDLKTHAIAEKMSKPVHEQQKLAEKRDELHHNDKNEFHKRKKQREDAVAAAYGEELAWLPKGPVPHQEVVYREGPRTPHGHENTATPPAVASPWPAELVLQSGSLSFTVKVEDTKIKGSRPVKDPSGKKMLHYRSVGNLLIKGTKGVEKTGQEKLHLQPSLLKMLFQGNLRIDTNDCTITTLAAELQTFPKVISAELRCIIMSFEVLQGSAGTEKETDNVVTVWWSATIARSDSKFVQLKSKWMLNANPTATTPVTKLIPEHAILLSLPSTGVKHKGTAMGTPFMQDKKAMWFAVEHPLAVNGILQNDKDVAVCAVVYLAELEAGVPSQQHSVAIGVSGDRLQMRRSFLAYLAETRAAPTRPFTHYNSWFDFASWQEPNASFHYRIMNEAICLDRIHQFGEQLVQQRGVKMDSFLWDDGWDNSSSLWNFNRSSFPRGFDKINVAASSYDIGTGVWLSPWGGYGSAKDERVEAAKREGYKVTMTDAGYGFSLNDPKYAQRFKEIMHSMVLRYGVNMFKVDGIGFEGEHHHIAKEMDGMLTLLKELRAESTTPLWLSLTTGTWPSPFWLQHGDSIWRGHGDLGLEGAGSYRMRWLRYRDAVVYHLVVAKSPWMPLSSLMLHGIVVGAVGQARHANLDHIDDINDFEQEVWTYFGMGVNLQELYLSPDRMTPAAWDVVAKAAKWARANHEMLQDSHWVGGDPLKPSVAYGYGSFHPDLDGSARFSICLRNPNSKPVRVQMALHTALELPDSHMEAVWELEPVYVPPGLASVFPDLKCGTTSNGGDCAASSTVSMFWNLPPMTAIVVAGRARAGQILQ